VGAGFAAEIARLGVGEERLIPGKASGVLRVIAEEVGFLGFGHDDARLPRKTFQLYKWIAMAAVAYCLWAVIGGDPDTVVRALVALLISVPLYPFFIRSMDAAAKRNAAEPAGAHS